MELQDSHQQVYGISFTHPSSCISPSFSKNGSRLLLPKRLLKFASKISFRKYKQKVVLLLICLFNYNLCQLPSCWMWRLTFSWVGFLSSKLGFIAKAFFFSQVVFWYVVPLNQTLIVVHHGDNTFISILTPASNTRLQQ